MTIDNNLLITYAIGTKNEIKRYASKKYFNNLGYAYYTEVILMSTSAWLAKRGHIPENIDHWIFIALFADTAVRWGSGIINSVRGHYAQKKAGKNPRLLEMPLIDPIPENPGLVGRVRELARGAYNIIRVESIL